MPCVACQADVSHIGVATKHNITRYLRLLNLPVPATFNRADFICTSCTHKARQGTCVKCQTETAIAVTAPHTIISIMNDPAYVYQDQDCICNKCYNTYYKKQYSQAKCIKCNSCRSVRFTRKLTLESYMDDSYVYNKGDYICVTCTSSEDDLIKIIRISEGR